MAGTDPRLIKIFEFCIGVMKQLGAVIVDPANLPNFNKFGKTETEVLHYEFKADLNKYLASANTRMKSMKDVIKFNEDNKERVLQYFGQEHMLTAQEKGSLRSKDYREALSRNLLLTRKNGIDAVMKKYKLDAIIVPSGGPAWMIDMANGDAVNWDMESTSVAAVAGYPHLTVPAGYILGLPVGISFFAKAWQEPTLIKLAYAFEQATKVRTRPEFLTSVQI
jgi:amidase